MKKSNNAPFKSMNGKMFYASREQLKEEVHQEINEHKVNIDQSVFERGDLKAHKKAIKESHTPVDVISKVIDMATSRKIRTINVTKINSISLQ